MDESHDLLTGDHFHVILHPDRVHGLIFNRLDRTVSTINYDDAKELSNIRYVGRIYGIVGRFLDRHLVLIKSRTKVGCLFDPISKTDHDVYVITQVQVLDLSNSTTTTQTSTNVNNTSNSVKYDATSDRDDHCEATKSRDFRPAEMQHGDDFSSLPITINTNSYLSSQARSNNWNPFKFANSLKPMVANQFLRSSAQGSNGGSGSQSCSRGQGSNSESNQIASASQTGPNEDADKRLVDEMVKLFNNTNSFYYSLTLDLTNRFSSPNLVAKTSKNPNWVTANERFFWNKYMLTDLIDLCKRDKDANHFICVVLKGFIAIKEQIVGFPLANEIEDDFGVLNGDGQLATGMIRMDRSSASCNINNGCDIAKRQDIPDDSLENSVGNRHKQKLKTYRLALVSRRSVFQAGTRYRRRGCDKEGNCANYVETEQIFKVDQHFTSMIILRGSIPLFWYQTGLNYRPPPVLTKSEDENYAAFSKHFNELIRHYKTEQIIAIDCTEQTGREKALHDAYKRQVEKLKSSLHPRVQLIEFDYHRYCRGRQCTDSQIERHLASCGLTEQLLKNVKYYWNDGDVVLEQEGVFRVNCIDCTDRTNVVQRIIALQILDIQLARLGIIAPDISPEENQCKRIMQTMWSANGNVLSTQYCGTRALFGGDRKLAGYLKDTYSSASRYYMSKFRDVYRQAAIDAMLGVENTEANNLEASQLKDQYELLSFDPLLAGQKGGAILRDVSSRVTNRLARLKGRFNAKPEPDANSGFVRYQQHMPNLPSGITETGLIETLGEMTIDWPSTEDLNGPQIEPGEEARETQSQDLFTRYATYDDNFQDDEFGQLMLSIDLAELQQIREEGTGEGNAASNICRQDEHGQTGDEDSQPEEIDLKEARCMSNQAHSREQVVSEKEETNTTST